MAWNLRTSNSSPTQNTTEGARDLFILTYSCNYLYSFLEASSCQFLYQYQLLLPDQGRFGHHSSIFTETKVHFMRFFAQRHLFKSSQLLRTKKLKSIFM